MSNVKSESPLARFGLRKRATDFPNGAGVLVRERPFLGHINLRGDPREPRFVALVNGILDVDLPVTPNTVSENRAHTVFWLGPNEWLIVTADARAAALVRELRQALQGLFAAVTEISGGQTAIVLRGPAARALLSKECPLDLHPRAFRPGQCAQTHLAKAPILLRQTSIEPSFELIVRRSFADYLWLWLERAAEEYGLAVVTQEPTTNARPVATV